MLGTAHYLSVRGRLKSRGGGGHVNFHVVSRGVAFNYDFPLGGGGGHVNIVDYSHKGTASISFDFPKCRWLLG